MFLLPGMAVACALAGLLYVATTMITGLADAALPLVATSGIVVIAIMAARGRITEGLVLAISMGVIGRLALAIVVGRAAYGGDARYYVALADALLEGRGLIADIPPYGAGVRAAYPPLYPILLAGARAIFGAQGTIVLNFAVDLIAALLVGKLSARHVGTSAAALLAAMYLLLPTVILSSPVPQKEGLANMLLLCIVLQASERRWITCGCAVGFLWLTQPALIGFWVFLLIVAIMMREIPHREGIRALIVSGASASLIACPWWLRNYQIFGEFIPFTTSGGLSLAYVANGLQHVAPPLLNVAEPARAAAAAQEAIDRIVSTPLDYLRSVTKQLARTIAVTDFPAQRLLATGSVGNHLPHAFAAISQMTWLAMSISLTWFFWARRRVVELKIASAAIIALLIHFAVINIWLEFGERHRYPLDPLLLILVGSSFLRSPRPQRCVRVSEIGQRDGDGDKND